MKFSLLEIWFTIFLILIFIGFYEEQVTQQEGWQILSRQGNETRTETTGCR